MAYVRFWQDEVKSYLADIADSEPLSSKREKELAKRIKVGDIAARNELVKANLRFVVFVAKEYQNRGLPIGELISVGNVGLIVAAERFDGEKGFKFISYAVWWIRQAILQALVEQSRIVRLPINKVGLLMEIFKMEEALWQDGIEEPSAEDLAGILDVKVEEIREALLAGRNAMSLDSRFEEEGDRRNLLEVIPSHEEPPDVFLESEDFVRIISEELSYLEDREARILRLYFGLNGEEPMTLEKIGVLFGLTRERIRQLKERALAKLRHPTHRGKLAVFVGGEEEKKFNNSRSKETEP